MRKILKFFIALIILLSTSKNFWIVQQTTMPQTGTTPIGLIITAVIILLGTVGYIKYRSIPLK